MKELILRLFAGVQLKNAVAYALKVSTLIVDALQGVLAGGGLGDDQRRKLHTILVAVAAIRDFLDRLSAIIGAPIQASPSEADKLHDAADKLNRIIDNL